MAPAGAVAGPFNTDVLPQIFAGGALGHDPFGAGALSLTAWVQARLWWAEPMSSSVRVGGAVVGGAVVTVGFGAGGAVVVGVVCWRLGGRGGGRRRRAGCRCALVGDREGSTTAGGGAVGPRHDSPDAVRSISELRGVVRHR